MLTTASINTEAATLPSKRPLTEASPDNTVKQESNEPGKPATTAVNAKAQQVDEQPAIHKKQRTGVADTPAAAPLSRATSVPIQPLYVKRLSEHARLPTRGSHLAAGYDLCSACDMEIPAGGRDTVPTDLAVAIPLGTYGRIAPRSGLACRLGIDVGAGVIDADYRGPLKILLFNFGQESFVIRRGDRIAQMVLERIITPEVVECSELDDTARGAGGFGSTGVASRDA